MFTISLKAARVNAEMTQDEAAKYMGVARATIHNWENGKKPIKEYQKKQFAELYKINLENIFFK